jgi:uncharacterized protein YkwD
MRARFAALALFAIVAAAAIPTAAVTATSPAPTDSPAPTPSPAPTDSPAPTPSPAPVDAAPADLTPAQAVSSMVAMLNADRAAAGLRPLRVDARMMRIAQVRANTMARENRLSHVSKAGISAFDLIEAGRIAWYLAGENIAWNNWPVLADSAKAVNRGWMGSRGHRENILSTRYNYFGIGLATRGDGGRFWAAVFLRGPDRTAPRVTGLPALLGPTAVFANGTTHQQVTWRWTGGDVPLATLTAGLRTFQVQRRVDGGRWVLVAQTRRRSLADWVQQGFHTEVRVRGIDRNGNVGGWSAPVGVDLQAR